MTESLLLLMLLRPWSLSRRRMIDMVVLLRVLGAAGVKIGGDLVEHHAAAVTAFPRVDAYWAA